MVVSFSSFSPNEYSGQFTSSLTVLNAQKSDEGNYTVEVFLGGTGGRVATQLFVVSGS